MHGHLRIVSAGILILGMASSTWCADDVFKSGPQPGTAEKPELIPGTFQCWMVTGLRAGRYHSPVCEHSLNPVVLVFGRNADDNELGTFLKKIDGLIAKHPDARLGCCAVILNDGGFRETLGTEGDEDITPKLAEAAGKKDELEVKLRELGKECKHVTFALDLASGPKEYKIHDEAQVTVLVYYKHVILGSYAFKEALQEKDADKLLQDIQKTVLEVEKMSRPRKR